MTSEYALRRLGRDEAMLITRIDRAEVIDQLYVLEKGELRLVDEHHDVPGWHPEQLAEYVVRLRDTLDTGGVVVAAFQGDDVAGIASLTGHPIRSDPDALQLDLLHVSRPHRGRGVGRLLTEHLAAEARRRGARRLYISATPTRGTVDAYMRMGAYPTARPDPELYALEPEDIHLTLRLRS